MQSCPKLYARQVKKKFHVFLSLSQHQGFNATNAHLMNIAVPRPALQHHPNNANHTILDASSSMIKETFVWDVDEIGHIPRDATGQFVSAGVMVTFVMRSY